MTSNAAWPYIGGRPGFAPIGNNDSSRVHCAAVSAQDW
jgi:hypothetical protein